jgi:peptide/nickel transport system substrate-binding protein
MQNRFGVKDFVFLLLLIVVGVGVGLSMCQADMRHNDMRDLVAKVETLEKQNARVQQSLDRSAEKMEGLQRAVGQVDSGLSGLSQRVDNLADRVRIGGTGPATSAPPAGDQGADARPKAGGGAATGATPEVVDRGKAGPAQANAQANLGSDRDDSWAKPGIPIAWQPERAHDSEPSRVAGYRLGGEITEIFNARTSTVMPLVYKDVYGAYVYERITEHLAEYDAKTLEPRGVLAQAWQYAPDGTWLRVRIHPRARFSDGEPVRAQDVIWTFNWMRNPQVQAERPRSITDSIQEVVEVDDRTVEFRFSKVVFSNLMAAMNSFTIQPRHFYEKFTPTQYNQATGLVMGSGPYKFATLDPAREWKPGEDVVLVRNEQYWGPTPPADVVRFKFINEDLARLTAFNNGDGDITQPSPPQFDALAKDQAWLRDNEARSWYNIRGGYNFIGWNCGPRNGKPTPFADKRVRRAMTMMLDREMIAREMFFGQARVSSGPFNSVTEQANPAIKPWPYDLSAARKLLAEAGWEDRDRDAQLENEEGLPFEFEFTYPKGNDVTERIVKYAKDQAAKLGIRCSLRPMDWSVFMQVVDNRDYDCMTMGWSPSNPESDPQQVWHSRYIANQGDNFVQWVNAEADAAVEAGREHLDKAKRMREWHRLHAVIHDEQPYTFLVERPWLRLVSKRVGNFSEYRTGFQYDELFDLVGGGAAAVNP